VFEELRAVLSGWQVVKAARWVADVDGDGVNGGPLWVCYLNWSVRVGDECCFGVG
jgi:hypothetical protein